MPGPPDRDDRRRLGAAGEAAVAEWYRAAGYDVLDRNWRCRDGELDLVLGRGGVIVFCEVKTRRSDAFGEPIEAVTRTKQRRLRGLAVRWLAEHSVHGSELRFDVAAVRAIAPEPRIDVVEAAF